MVKVTKEVWLHNYHEPILRDSLTFYLQRQYPWQKWKFTRDVFVEDFDMPWAEAGEEWNGFAIKPGQEYCVDENRSMSLLVKVQEINNKE